MRKTTIAFGIALLAIAFVPGNSLYILAILMGAALIGIGFSTPRR